MNYDKAIQEAEKMIQYLSPVCERIEIAGSLRRAQKNDFDEIDLVLIPDLTPPPMPRVSFGEKIPKIYKRRIDKAIDLLGAAGDLQELGRVDGPRKKAFFYRPSGIRFDLYLVCPPATWGVQFLIRTGPEDFGHWIVTRRSGKAFISGRGVMIGGALPDGYRVQGGAVWEGEEKVSEKELLEGISIGFDTEIRFLDWLGLGWIDPGERVARWGSFK